jgi:CHAT domain-containing protein/tetratricopeptide (TPR) repeat protein
MGMMMRRVIWQAMAGVAIALATPAVARPFTAAETQQLATAQTALSQAMSAKDWNAASAALRTAMTINRAALGPDHPDTLVALETLGIAQQLAGRNADALVTLREAEAARTRRGDAQTAEMAAVQAGIGVNLNALGKAAEAAPPLRRALAIRLKTNGPDSREAAFVRNALGQALTADGKYGEARDLFAAVVASARAADGGNGNDLPAALGNLASAETSLGQFDKAQALHDEALALNRKRSGAKSMPVAVSLNNIGFLKSQRGDNRGAETAFRESLTILRGLLGNDAAPVASTLGNLASAVQNGGRPADAIPLFRDALGVMTRVRGADHPDTIRIESNLATALSDLSRDAEAEPIMRRILAARRAALGPTHPDTVTAVNNLAAVTERLGREQEAEALYREAIAVSQTKGGDPTLLASTVSGLATNLGEQGRYGEALQLHTQALDLRQKLLGPQHPDVAISLSNVGYILGQQRKYAEATQPLAMAVEIGRRNGSGELGLAASLNNYAANLAELKRYADAEKVYREALAIRTKRLGPNHPLTANVLNNLGHNAFAQGKNPQALTLFRSALTALRTGSRADNPDLIPPLGNLAILLADKPATQAEALSLARESVAIARQRRALLAGGGTGDAATRAAARARGDDALGADPAVTAFIGLAEVNWAVAARNPAQSNALFGEAFVAAQEVDLSKAAQAMARTAARTASGGGALGTLVARQQALADSLGVMEADYVDAIASNDLARANAAEAAQRAAASELASLDAAIDVQFPAYRALIAPTPLAAGDIAKRLQKDEGLIFIVPLNGSMYSYAIGPGGSRWHRVDKGQAGVAGRVDLLLCQLDPVTCGAGASSDAPMTTAEREGYRRYDRGTAFSLYADLVQPVESALKGANRVYTVSVGKIGALPLGLLPTEAPKAGSDDADPDLLAVTPWLADRYVMVTLPSVGALRFADQPRAVPGQAFVGYGAPLLGGKSGAARALRGSGLYRANRNIADQSLLSSLAPLPGTEIELKAMAIALGGGAKALRLSTAATEASLKQDKRLGDTRVIAFATHGLLPGELDGFDEPGLVFTPPSRASAADDGVLSASEAAALRLNADWVILSACNTAAGDAGAAGLSGLARAFLFAGAQSLLASHWRVSDDATARLTVEALAGDKTMTRGQAMQAAMRAVRTGKRADGSAIEGWKADWAHPTYWAPFSLIANSDR